MERQSRRAPNAVEAVWDIMAVFPSFSFQSNWRICRKDKCKDEYVNFMGWNNNKSITMESCQIERDFSALTPYI